MYNRITECYTQHNVGYWRPSKLPINPTSQEFAMSGLETKGNWSTIESTMECRIADMIPTIQIHPQWMIGNQAASCQDYLIQTLCLTQSVPKIFQIFWPHDLGKGNPHIDPSCNTKTLTLALATGSWLSRKDIHEWKRIWFVQSLCNTKVKVHSKLLLEWCLK